MQIIAARWNGDLVPAQQILERRVEPNLVELSNATPGQEHNADHGSGVRADHSNVDPATLIILVYLSLERCIALKISASKTGQAHERQSSAGQRIASSALPVNVERVRVPERQQRRTPGRLANKCKAVKIIASKAAH